MAIPEFPPLATCSFPEYREEMGVPVRISTGFPRYIRYPLPWKIEGFMPTRPMLSLPKERYEERFSEIWRRELEVSAAEAWRIHQAVNASPTTPLVLMCFEQLARTDKGRGNWCHRSMLGGYFAAAGIVVPELGAVPGPPPPPPDFEEVELF
ncbi:hypothetical protein [Streptacidiphilus cavernicola]|uniref:Uncharacterized protein n=1 Tax=Streptacidiphilus cavernicola TaxID=3342716 RepID=A0ABV6VYC2_9ACTN